MENVLITGANRGIGLELAKQFAAAGNGVLATCRDQSKADALVAAGDNVSVYELEVSDPDSVAALQAELQGTTIDALILNAGISGRAQSTSDMDYAGWAEAFAVNTMAPFCLFTALKPNLLRAERPRVVTVSSALGALSDERVMGYAYQSTKAAVNKVMQLLAKDVECEGIIAVPVHPGWVRTDMGGPNADLSVEESASGLMTLINGLTMAQSGRFWNWDGTEHAW